MILRIQKMLKRIILLQLSSFFLVFLIGCNNEEKNQKIDNFKVPSSVNYIFYYNNGMAAGSPVNAPDIEKSRVVMTDKNMNIIKKINIGNPSFPESEQIRYNYDSGDVLFSNQITSILFNEKDGIIKEEELCSSHIDYLLTYFHKNERIFVSNASNILSFQINDKCYMGISLDIDLSSYLLSHLYYDNIKNTISLYIIRSETDELEKLNVDLHTKEAKTEKIKDSKAMGLAWGSIYYKKYAYSFTPGDNIIYKYNLEENKIVKKRVLKYGEDENISFNSFRITRNGEIATVYKNSSNKMFLLIYNDNLELKKEIEISGEDSEISTYFFDNNVLYYSLLNGKFKRYNLDNKKIEEIGDFSKLEMSDQPGIYVVDKE